MSSRTVIGALAVFVGAMCVPTMARAATTIPGPTMFSYTGAEQTYTVPPGVVLVGLAAVGGHGGDNAEGGGREGGVGALAPVTPGQKLYAEVGAAGVYGGDAMFGGGGAGGAPPPVVTICSNGSPCSGDYASSGGGASDVRTCSMSAVSCPGGVNSSATRLIVGGGGGRGGSGNAPSVTCGASSGGGGANNFQYPPGNASNGPVPIVTSAGTVYPGRPTTDAGSPGVTPAGGGTAAAGTGGRQAGCSTGGSTGMTDSIAGSDAVGGVGGTGGDASSLGPKATSCSGNTCSDAGPGGGGGGGYFGGGGGATGLDQPTGNCGACNAAGSGQGGGGGSSFVSSKTQDPIDEEYLKGDGDGVVYVVPAVEINSPANGAVYLPGQVVNASWSCGYDGKTGLGASSCTAPAADGAAISTTPGTHTFTVTGSTTDASGKHAVTASVTYVVGSSTTGTKSTHASAAGYRFTVRVPTACTAPSHKLPVTLSRKGSSSSYRVVRYSLYIDNVKKLSVSHTGPVSLSLSGQPAGTHTLKVVVLLRSTNSTQTKRATLTTRFSVC